VIAPYRPVALNHDDPDGPKFEGSFAPATPPLRRKTLNVVSYNIRFGRAITAAVRAFRHHRQLADADLVFLQEMDEVGTREFARQLQYNYVYYPACIHNVHGRNFGNAILTRLPFVHTEKVILPGRSPLNREMRLAAKACIEVGAREMMVYSTHTEVFLSPTSHRRRQVETLIADIPEQAEHVIIGGDFNTVSYRGINRLVAQFAQAGLQRASKGAGSTMVSYPYRPTAADHIFVRGLKALDRGAVRTAIGSDHAPVWVELSVEDDD
jgi:endonuclease/exonuclease/phosphatase family metal-dependent hydrolase